MPQQRSASPSPREDLFWIDNTIPDVVAHKIVRIAGVGEREVPKEGGIDVLGLRIVIWGW